MKIRFAIFISAILLLCVTIIPTTLAQTDQDYPVITPENITQVEQLKVFGEGIINDVIFSPDEQYLAMSSSVGIWLYSIDDLTTPIRLFGNYEIGVNLAIFNADSTRLFGATEGGAVYVWDVATEQIINKIPSNNFISTPHPLNTQYFVTFNTSQTENQFLSEILIWDLKTNTSIQTTLNQEGRFQIAGFSNNGKYLVTIFGRIASVWDTKTGDLVNQIDMQELCCSENLIFSPDGESVVIVGVKSPADNYTRGVIWNYIENTVLIPDLRHRGLITSIEFSSDSNYLLSSGYDSLKIWNLKTDSLIIDTLEKYSGIKATFSPDGSYFAVSHNNGFNIIETETGEMLYSFGIGDVYWVDFSPSGNVVMVIQGKTIQFWDIFTIENLYTIQIPSFIYSARFNDEGNLIITEMRDGTIRLFGIPTP